MTVSSALRLHSTLLLVLGIAAGCASHKASSRATAPAASAVPSPVTAAAPAVAVAPSKAAKDENDESVVVPVSDRDPTWGSPLAPVTVIEFSDFQCPFCGRAGRTLEELQRMYGPEQLRVVWKNFPLPFHAKARPAADAAMTVFRVGGAEAFWKFHDLIFANQRAIDAQKLRDWAEQSGVGAEAFDAAFAVEQQAAKQKSTKIDEDLALASRLGIRGTPVFRINGIPVLGAQPIGAFIEIIDAQLELAQKQAAAGVPASALYPTLSAHNAAVARAEREASETPEPEDTTIWRVPVRASDPVRGVDDALVTLVLFSDFQCPFCKRMEETLRTLENKYGANLRIVWKDYPLPFHQRALPAAVVARTAMAQKGPSAFWRAHDALFERQEELSDDAFKAVAKEMGLAWADVQKALHERRFQGIFDESEDLARTLKVEGTPCAFVNGLRVEGAVPAERLAMVIDQQMARARTLADARKSRVGIYDAITERGMDPDRFEHRQIEAPPAENPSRGDAAAKVVVQVFSDFECPFCQRLDPTLVELEKRLRGRVHLVWRDYPLPFHAHAALAAEAAREVFVQKGAPAFWQYHDLLFSTQSAGGLEPAGLERSARKVGVDIRRFRSALKAHTHQAAIQKDIDAAKSAGLGGTPVVVIGGYVVSGVRPLSVLERLANRVLAEGAAPEGSPAPAPAPAP